jgi:hypothetical protein
VIVLPGGHEYYSGGFKSKSSAYRYSVKETEKHKWAFKTGMNYNTRGL